MYYSYSVVLNSYQLLVLFYSSIPYIDWSKFLTFIPFLLKFQKYIKLVCAISFINWLTRGKKKVYNIIEKKIKYCNVWHAIQNTVTYCLHIRFFLWYKGRRKRIIGIIVPVVWFVLWWGRVLVLWWWLLVSKCDCILI